tara:strand:- start:45 stop:521 length:477 start_codon:yes stop_codon:yes gene_type:complete
MTKTYLVFDLELFWDARLFEGHRTIDTKSDRRATAVKRVMAASALEFSIDDEGLVATGELASWTEHGWGDEGAVAAQMFDYLRAPAHAPFITFGGLATDIPALVLASMAHGLTLPPAIDRSTAAQRTAPASRSVPDVERRWVNLVASLAGAPSHGDPR